MKNLLLLMALSGIVSFSEAQILKIATSPSAISTQVPGYSQITSISTKLLVIPLLLYQSRPHQLMMIRLQKMTEFIILEIFSLSIFL